MSVKYGHYVDSTCACNATAALPPKQMAMYCGSWISIYALCEYPQVFGGAAALSTHWVGRPSSWGTPDRLQNASLPLAAFQYLQVHLPKANTRRLYMDHGTTGLDAVYG